MEPTLEMLAGRDARVQALAAEHGLSQDGVTLAAASILGTVGSPRAVRGLLAAWPEGECGAKIDDPQVSARAVIANALGLIADDRAVATLCTCATASRHPGELFSIVEALGRIGGARATACLAGVIEHGSYHPDLVSSPRFIDEIRWEAARFAVLASDHERIDTIEAAIEQASQSSPEVAAGMRPWVPGIELVQRCGGNRECLLTIVGDDNAPWFAREVAAMHAARLGKGEVSVAERIAKAFAVTDPDARVTMAWLAAWAMQGRHCSTCAAILEQRLSTLIESRPAARDQLSVLWARYAIVRLR